VTPLERALRDRIQSEGPISVAAYMEACNAYYYATRDPLGAAGDFTTAPEISQMFGEMVGAALADTWLSAGSPVNSIYAELGPGRGTLAADALRVLRRSGFEGEVHLVETSPVLRDVQRQTVPEAIWHERIEDLPDRPFLLVANEFLDALPIQQHVGGIERRVTIVGGGLTFDRDGQIVEISPAREHAVRTLSRRLVKTGGVAFLIDYGYEQSTVGDTLQAVHAHSYAPVLSNPGEQDLTAHVDFEIVAAAAQDDGARVTALVRQGGWLKRLGIEARADALARANPEQADNIRSALHRLTATDEMGELFKVIAIHSPDWPAPEGFRMIYLRDGQIEDAAALDRIFDTVFCDTFAHLYRSEDLDAFLTSFGIDDWEADLVNPSYAIRVAEVDGNPVAFCKLGPQKLPVETNRSSMVLDQLYVLKEYHGAGIAQSLMTWAFHQAQSRNAEELYLTVYVDNHRARRFYDRYGFEPVGRYDFMVGNHADEDIIMRKVL
jgi:NADH dehydrogenase [ubiquinone] 1 alpha subcomplex assembly factor 7